MNSGVLDLKIRRKVSLAPPADAGDDADFAVTRTREGTAATAIDWEGGRHKSAAKMRPKNFTQEIFIELLDAGDACRRFMAACAAGSAAKRTRSYQYFGVGQSKSYLSLLGLKMAQRNRQRVGGISRLRRLRHREQGTYHQLHLAFVGVAISCDARLYFARRIALDGDAMLGRGQQHYAADLGKPQRRPHIESGKNGFDGHNG